MTNNSQKPPATQLQIDVACDENELPTTRDFQTWVDAALLPKHPHKEMSIRIVSRDEIAELNATYRKKNGPTNVLSFPVDLPAGVDVPLLGDLIICAEVVAAEAHTQNKSLQSHWAHMVIHGTLHLLGYDHQSDVDASIMENLEIAKLATLGYSNPYLLITDIEEEKK